MLNNHMYLCKLFVVCALAMVTGCAISTPMSSVDTAILTGDGWISEKSYYEKTVHYGTTRIDKHPNKTRIEICSEEGFNISDKDCKENILRLDTGNREGNRSIKYGRATVKIPYQKELGSTSGMSLMHLDHDIEWDNFISKISSDDLLIFVHGFNTSFTNAAIRSAQLAHDTNFKGEAVFYSWPSRENPFTYDTDKDRAKENFELLADFIQQIAQTTDKNIHIVAHSMGTYILMNSLASIERRIKKDNNILQSRRKKLNEKLFGQIILAAPDIARDDYHQKFNKHNFSKMAERITLYSSENDHVLDVSQLFNHFIENTNQARLGDSSASFFVIPGMDTVDARKEISPQFFGHSFYAEYRSLVADIHLILNYSAGPDNRMLQRVVDKNNNNLWFIRD